jgi:hypothetical protein
MKLESAAVVEAADRIVVLGLDRIDASPVVLEGTALAVWREIDGESDTDEIVARLSETFDLDAARILADVEDFLDRLVIEQVVTRTNRLSSPAERRTA